MRRFWAIALLCLAGCARTISRPPDSGKPPPRPAFEKTFGDITVGADARMSIRYRDIRLEIHPGSKDSPLNDPASIDYLLLTNSADDASLAPLQKNLKIIAPPAEAPKLQSAGFSSVKALAGGRRLLLKKNQGFLFVSGVPAGNDPRSVAGYLLEFDNGRNVLVLGAVPKADDLREFLYGLRDDGKELDLAFLPAMPADEDKAAHVLALLQPRVGLLLPKNGKAAFDRAHLADRLKQELFYGAIYLPAAGEVIPF